MKNLRENKGITLVALIITIIVLLILAVVTISAVNEGSLFAHANNAATSYSKAQDEENTMISNWLTELANHDNGNVSTTLSAADLAGTYWLNGDSSTLIGAKYLSDSTFEGYTDDGATGNEPNVLYGTYTINGNIITATSPEGYIDDENTPMRNIIVIFRIEEINGNKALVLLEESFDGHIVARESDNIHFIRVSD